MAFSKNQLKLKPGHQIFGSGADNDIVIQEGRLYRRAGGEELPLDAERIRREHNIEVHPRIQAWILKTHADQKLATHSGFLSRLSASVQANVLARLESGELSPDTNTEELIDETVSKMLDELGATETSTSTSKKKKKKNGRAPAPGSSMEDALDDEEEMEIEV
jgi:hypothetical protein